MKMQENFLLLVYGQRAEIKTFDLDKISLNTQVK